MARVGPHAAVIWELRAVTLSTSMWSLHVTWASLGMAVGSKRGVSRESIPRDASRNFKASHALAAEVRQCHFGYIPLIKLSHRPIQVQQEGEYTAPLNGRSRKEFAAIFGPLPLKTKSPN